MSDFIGFSREDAKAAEWPYTDVKAAGADPWLDKRDLRAGQLWKLVINEAISCSRYSTALLSSRSVNKLDYVQEEVKQNGVTRHY